MSFNHFVRLISTFNEPHKAICTKFLYKVLYRIITIGVYRGKSKMKKLLIVGIIGMMLLAISPNVAAKTEFTLSGGIGVQITATVCCGDTATVEYKIEGNNLLIGGTEYLGPGNSYWTERFRPFRFISPITVTLETHDNKLVKNGLLIGIFVLI